ncbi:HMG domain-containing protein 3 [Takifugu rubripes]|uniref:HMG-box containing 3 n=1 Tax=Takifugu rubripes TaxID=31033 RepID=H2SPH4_TAKRU|nr:HMG domain-containing protein 3 [Takifugu rubripes]XP_011608960.2 HMG domain-containing protein 3 [Takifugu rubripes]XP_011608961.2 HMG domain-containing protein 3 [Takifugu rubripes]
MEKDEVFDIVKVTEEVESYNQSEVATPKKKKSKSQEVCADKPKKPRSAYLLYYFDVHQILQQEASNIPQSEINKRISESWKRLSVAEKAYYLEKAKAEKDGTDRSSPNPSKDVPGYRKILPRADYLLLSKGCSSNQPLGSPESEVYVDSTVDSILPSAAVTQGFTPLGLTSEVEHSEQAAVLGDITEETVLASHPADPQEIASISSSSLTSKAQSSMDTCVDQDPDLAVTVVTLKGNKSIADSGSAASMLLQKLEEPAQMVALIPAQNRLEPTFVPGFSSLSPMMMFSVGSSKEQSISPSYKMSVKTYTRRGRGKCLNPQCSFIYVTRHKPPKCPECGHHLGGKWIPVAKKSKEKDTAFTSQKTDSQTGSCQAEPPAAQEANSDLRKTNKNKGKRDLQVQRRPGKKPTLAQPLEGSSIRQQKKLLKTSSKPSAAEGCDSSSVPAHKRPVRPILPAYCSTAGRTLVHIFAVPPEKAANNNNRSLSVPQDSFSRLKPSTLKQLGQTVTTTTTMQGTSVPANGSQPVTSSGDRRVNFLSFLPLKQQNSISNLDLGLSTARGRGRCKNPSCDYMYKNRHKPAVCPKCGCELAQKSNKEANSVPLLDPYQPLSPAQKDTQRHSTLQLLQRSLQIPEGETELQETLTLIQELNSLQIVLIQTEEQQREFKAETETLVESRWPRFYECAATHCSLCNYPLFKGGQSTIAGQEDCWLLTETLVQSVSLQLKVCLNLQCLALHSFTDLHPGLFNVGNKLLVSLDLFLKVRARIKLGHHPTEVTRTILDQSHPVHNLSSEELSQILELLLSGYWAFECLTVRDYNDMICGICGVAPKLEFAQRYSNNVLELKNVEFTWPEYSVSDEVHMDDFWLTMETEAIEQAIFPTDIPITRVDASIIAPFFPPLMRGPTVINTEKDKVQAPSPPSGDPAVLVRLVHDGKLNLDKMEDHTEEELRAILGRCGANITPASTKDELLASLFSLYTFVHSSLPTAPPPPSDLTAGKLSKLCPHKVVCGSKYLVRGETARDHVDLLLSSRYWPPVYISDCARSVALCADMHYSELATKMWGRNQGCFSDPFEKTQVVSCPELQDQPYSADVSLVETHHVHPITKSSSCWLVCSPGAAQEDAAFPSEHHSIHLCRELEPYVSLISDPAEGNDMAAEGKGQTDDAADDVTSERSDACSSADRVRQQPAVFNNPAYYYLYNRLVDFLTSRDIVCQQINKVVQACQPGDVVIRDALCRLGVAQIKTEKEEDGEMKVQMHEGGAETYRVVLPE